MGVQGRGGLVHQQHLRLHRQGPGNAQALLLAAGKAQALFFSRSFSSSQMAAPRRDFSTISSSFYLGADAVGAGP